MLHSLDARRGRLLTNSLYTQTSGAELHALVGSLHEGSSVRLTQPSTGEVPTASLESCRFVSRWSSFASPIARYQNARSRLASSPQNHIPSANRWPAYCLASHYEHTSIASHTPARLRWLIFFSLIWLWICQGAKGVWCER